MARPQIRVLLVEDDEADAHRVEIMLKRAEDVSFKVQRATTLKAALTVIEAQEPEIVLLDLSLSDYQGYDTVVEFSKQTDVPFVVLTGNDDLTMAMRCVSLGAQDYVLKSDVTAKPLERTMLMAVKRASNQRASRDLEMASREMVLGDDQKATVSLLRPQVSQLIELVEDVENYLRKNAPGLVPDVRSIFDKHDADVTIKSLRDTLRLYADHQAKKKSSRPLRKISDQALKAVDGVIAKHSPSPRVPKVTEEIATSEADNDLLDIIHRRDA